MGCTSSNPNELQQKVLPLPPDIINAYIDRVSIVMINKIKDKFQSHLKPDQSQIQTSEFIAMFKNSSISDNRKKSLYHYFNNNSRKTLALNKFIQKYCILVKSDVQHFSQIVHRLYCKSVDFDKMSKQDFCNFQQQCHPYLKTQFGVSIEKFPMVWSQFFAITQKQTDWEEIQKNFQIVSIDELPYKAFHEQFQRFSQEWYQKDQSYFIVQAEWFSQWIFFYEYQDTDIKNSHYRSTRSDILIKKKKSITSYKKKMSNNRNNSSKIVSNQNSVNIQSLEPPTQIIMTGIQGEYFGELKPFLNAQRDITVINQTMWKILKSMLGCDIEFKRSPIDEQNIDLYPVSIYLYKTDTNSIIDHSSLEIILVKRKSSFQQTLKNLKPTDPQGIILFYKKFGQKKFVQWSSDVSLQEISADQPRLIVVKITNSQKLNFQKQYSPQINPEQKIEIGDKILAYLSYEDKFAEAFVLNFDRSKKQYKVHFNGYSYHYERWVKATDIKPSEENQNKPSQPLTQFKKQQFFNGLRNIGNTCFINSTLQSLVSTSIFDKFFLKANLSSKKYPLSFVLSQIVKGLVNKQKFSIYDFKKIINNKMPMFSGYDQHDAQQFLNLLLDKLDEELVQKPNIVDELFGGVMESKFTCLKCKQVKKKEEKIHSISLPIPEPEYNYFVIMVFSIYASNVRKIVLRLHRNARINEYMSEIEQRTDISRFDMVFIESQYSVLKRFRNELTFQANEDKKITDLGLNSNVQIWAYQKIRNSSIEYRLKENRKKQSSQKVTVNCFYDFYSNEDTAWGIAKIITITQQKITFQFLKDLTLTEVQLKRQEQTDGQFNDLGSKLNEKMFRKLYLRKFSQSSQKMVFFDFQFVIGLPKWSSYNDVHVFVDEYLKKLKNSKHQNAFSRQGSQNSRIHSFDDLDANLTLNQQELRLTSLNSTFIDDKKRPYIINFLQPLKSCCFFCQKQIQPFHSASEIKNCCQPDQKDIPMYWAGKQKNFYLVIDWVQMDQYNQKYCNNIQIDNFSVSAEHKMKNQQINLQKCLDLWKKPENIQMQCQKCKFDEHLLQTSIKKAPIITIFHLKQFRYSEEGHFVKLNVNLQWQQSINLEKYMSNQVGKNNLYEMYSVVEHKGNANAGHYTTLAKRKHPLQRKKVWVNFDDENAEILAQKPKSIQNAYLLFFKKVDIPSSAIVHFSI